MKSHPDLQALWALSDPMKTIAATTRKAAAVKRDNAAYGGHMGDDGASRLEEIVNAWEAGLKGEIPESLMKYAKQAAQETDRFRRGLYLHKKGGLYQALSLAIEEATRTPVVIYQHVDGEQVGGVLWTRPLTSWNEIVEWPDSRLRPRFVWADDPDLAILRQAEQCATTTVDRIKSAMVEARGKRNEAEAQVKAK